MCKPKIEWWNLISWDWEIMTDWDVRKCKCVMSETCYWIACLLTWDRIEEATEKYNKAFN